MSRFWQFAQLSDKHKTQSSMDQISQSGQLFLGGLKALGTPDNLKHVKITHILSVLEFDYCDFEEFEHHNRFLVQVEDNPQENLLQHFETTNAFLDSALDSNGAALVHCAMGVSRSATVICAYLMHKQSLSSTQALKLVQKSRPSCAPNEGFIEQLNVYDQMLRADSKANAANVYTAWLYKRTKEISKI